MVQIKHDDSCRCRPCHERMCEAWANDPDVEPMGKVGVLMALHMNGPDAVARIVVPRVSVALFNYKPGVLLGMLADGRAVVQIDGAEHAEIVEEGDVFTATVITK